MEVFLGTILAFGFNFAPRGWAFCQGQTLSISQNTALFALLGTTYGGNGVSTFGLPDLRGRTLIGQGQGPGLSPYLQGQVSGQENVTLSTNQMPSHTHSLNAYPDAGNVNAPAGALLANTGSLDPEYRTSGSTPVQMQGTAIGLAGNNQPFSVLQPYLAINYCIALEGIFPSRN